MYGPAWAGWLRRLLIDRGSMCCFTSPLWYNLLCGHVPAWASPMTTGRRGFPPLPCVTVHVVGECQVLSSLLQHAGLQHRVEASMAGTGPSLDGCPYSGCWCFACSMFFAWGVVRPPAQWVCRGDGCCLTPYVLCVLRGGGCCLAKCISAPHNLQIQHVFKGFGVVALRGTRLEALCGAAGLIASSGDQVAEHVWVCLIWLGYTAGTSNGRCLQQPAVAFDRDGLRVHANSACTIFGSHMSRPAAACAAMYACRGRWQMPVQYHPQTALQGTPLQALSFLFVPSVRHIWWLQCHHSGTVARARGCVPQPSSSRAQAAAGMFLATPVVSALGLALLGLAASCWTRPLGLRPSSDGVGCVV
jgi:hypothetical protein